MRQLLGILLLVTAAQAETLNWQIATQYEDGSALPPAEIVGHWIICDGDFTLVSMPATAHEVTAPGVRTCVARTLATNGEESRDSLPVSIANRAADPVASPDITWQASTMAYSDGNSVAITADYGFNISAPTGIQSGGYPVTFAIAFKPTTNSSANDALVAIARASGNHLLEITQTTATPNENDTTAVNLHSQAGGATQTVTSTALLTRDAWSIVVVKFIDADNWKVVIDDNALQTFSTVGGASPTGVDTLYYMNRRDVIYATGNTAYAAAWFSELSDVAMASIATGTTPPSDHAPDELIYFESTTAIEGENGSTVNQTGAGSIAVDNTDPAGWPPAAAGGDIAATGTQTFGSSATLSAAGSLAATGAVAFASSADLDAPGSLAAAGAIAFTGAANLTSGADNDLAATGSVAFAGSADLGAVGELAATGAMAFGDSADLTATGALAATGAMAWTSSADLDATGALEAAGVAVFGASADLNALGALAASSGITFSSVADLTDANAAVQPEVLAVTLHRGLNIQLGVERADLIGHGSRLIKTGE